MARVAQYLVNVVSLASCIDLEDPLVKVLHRFVLSNVMEIHQFRACD